jgi:hypothetical protein
MMKKNLNICIIAMFLLLLIGCQNEGTKGENTSNNDEAVNQIETTTFSEAYRPDWWNNLNDTNKLFSYAYADGPDEASAKASAEKSAQAKLLHYKKDYVVNLTAMILKESDSQGKFKSNQLNAKNQRIFEGDYSPYLQAEKADFIPKNNEIRAFVALSLPLEKIQAEYVRLFHKDKSYAKTFIHSQTYRYLLQQAGIDFKYNEGNIAKRELKKDVKKEIKKETPSVKYDQDIMPAWFKISYNTNKVMVNQSAEASSQEESLKKAMQKCLSNKLNIANNYARTEAEKYRGLSEYDEVKFARFKNQISAEIMKQDYPLTKEFAKTIHIGQDKYKSYVQYSINKKSIQNTLLKVLKSDEVLYSRLRASMAFDELENEEF